MLTLVCATNNVYVQNIKQLLLNINQIINDKHHINLNINVIIYDLGMTTSKLEELKMLYPNFIFETFDFSKYPDHVSLEKYCNRTGSSNPINYSWKVCLIYEVCEKYGDLVHWMDARNLYTDFTKLIAFLKKNYFYSPISKGIIKNYTHPLCIKYLEYRDSIKYIDCKCRASGMVGINYNIDWCRDLIKEWKDLSLDLNCISPEGANRSNHRQDQSILQLLYYYYQNKYKFKIENNYINLMCHNGLYTNLDDRILEIKNLKMVCKLPNSFYDN